MKTSEKHFILFKEECQEWVKRLELSQWDIIYKHEKLNDFDCACNNGVSTYTANISLDTEWENYNIIGEKITDEDIKRAAKHEVIHILLKRLVINASSRYVNKSEIEEAEEELVRKLEKVIK